MSVPLWPTHVRPRKSSSYEGKMDACYCPQNQKALFRLIVVQHPRHAVLRLPSTSYACSKIRGPVSAAQSSSEPVSSSPSTHGLKDPPTACTTFLS